MDASETMQEKANYFLIVRIPLKEPCMSNWPFFRLFLITLYSVLLMGENLLKGFFKDFQKSLNNVCR